MIALLAILVLCSGIALDYADARNTLAVAEKRPHAAALWSVAMYAVGCIGFFTIIRVSPWLVVPEAAGLYAGSWLAVRKSMR